MEHWDPQMMLNMYIHNYFIRKDMHISAEIFAREANFYPRAVAINPPEGFLSEWWSLFWSVYSARCLKNTEATEGPSFKVSSILTLFNCCFVMCHILHSPRISHHFQASENLPQNSHLVMQSPDVSYMLQNTRNLLQSDLSTMMLRSEPKLPISNSSVMEGQTITNLIAARTHEQEPLGLHARDFSSGSQLLNADQFACMLTSSSYSSHQQEKVYNNPHLCFTRDIGTSLRRSTAVEPTLYSPKAIQFQMEPVDTDSRMHKQERLELPVRNLNSSSQISDVNQLACLLPSSSNYCSHLLENVYKRPLLSIARDDKSGSCLRISTAEEPTCNPRKAIQLKTETIDKDARICESDHHRLPVENLTSNSQLLDGDQLAPFLPSPSNCSHPPKNKKRQLSVTRDDDHGSCLRRSTKSPTPHAPKVIQLKTEPSDADGKIHEQEPLRLPVREFNSNSQLLGVDQIARLLSSSSNCSPPLKYVNKKGQHSLNRDDRCATSLRRSTAVEPTRRMLKAMHRKRQPPDNEIVWMPLDLAVMFEEDDSKNSKSPIPPRRCFVVMT
ncbi:hypothetical protein CDL12_26176 [Handroanthus impetiginosus]|uniref:Uncharacterized protein n=1 Tax=Handroanthus impetiginosus TaxID=429701 RepID=A0A2G9G7N7_9LAMI|nr:hypothetical protein CDL12_26176 [Handroanthus impetiginosus]